jgi:hypothetical protein
VILEQAKKERNARQKHADGQSTATTVCVGERPPRSAVPHGFGNSRDTNTSVIASPATGTPNDMSTKAARSHGCGGQMPREGMSRTMTNKATVTTAAFKERITTIAAFYRMASVRLFDPTTHKQDVTLFSPREDDP